MLSIKKAIKKGLVMIAIASISSHVMHAMEMETDFLPKEEFETPVKLNLWENAQKAQEGLSRFGRKAQEKFANFQEKLADFNEFISEKIATGRSEATIETVEQTSKTTEQKQENIQQENSTTPLQGAPQPNSAQESTLQAKESIEKQNKSETLNSKKNLLKSVVSSEQSNSFFSYTFLSQENALKFGIGAIALITICGVTWILYKNGTLKKLYTKATEHPRITLASSIALLSVVSLMISQKMSFGFGAKTA
jgi:hypothetical protein